MRFRNTGQFPADKEALAAALKAYGIGDFAFTEPDNGIENATFLITADERYALRVYRQAKKLGGEIEQELAFMELLHNNDLPVPAVQPTAKGGNITRFSYNGQQWDAILMDFVEGSHPDTYSIGLVNEMARMQATMHNLGTKFADTQKHTRSLDILQERHFNKLVNPEEVADSALLAFVERAKAFSLDLSADLPRGYSHYDFDSGNILVDSTQNITGILDFDDLQYAPVVVCLAYTLWNIFADTSSYKTVDYYIAEYEKVRTLTERERTFIAPIMLFRNYVIGCLHIAEGKDPKRLAGYLERETLLKSRC